MDLPTKQPTRRDPKIERQFSGQHGAVARNFNGADPIYFRYHRSHDWKGGSVAKQIGGHLYDVTLADGSARRFHDNQMQLKFTHLTDDEFTAFANAVNLPVRHAQGATGETGHLDEHAVNDNQDTSNQETPAMDDVKPEQLSNASEPRRSKRGHIPKKPFELDPTRTSMHKLIPGLPVLFLF